MRGRGPPRLAFEIALSGSPTNFSSILISLSQLLMSTRSPLAELNVLKKICDHPRLLSTLACEQLGLDEEDRFVTAFQPCSELTFATLESRRKNWTELTFAKTSGASTRDREKIGQ